MPIIRSIPVRGTRMLLTAAAACAALLLVAGSTASGQVTLDRLRNADNEPENWLVYGGTYRSMRYSALDQIDTGNVHTLKAAWAFQAGVMEHGLQSTPLVADGVMYLSTSGHRVYALDAATGREIWRYVYEHSAPHTGDGRRPVETVRGLALGHGNLYFGTDDNYVVAVDVETGEESWRTLVEDRAEWGCFMRAAPLLVNDIVVVGSRGGDLAHRGHIVAFDAHTGEQRWWFHIIPGPGEPGNETWAGDSWRYGGGAAWMTGSYDPELDLIYWGTGNASSDFYGGHRRGANLYTNSIVALRAATGELEWHFQTIPHDVWDFDSAYENILVDLPVDGEPRKLLIHPDKNGYVYVLDRTDGEYIAGWKYVDTLTWTTGLDAARRAAGAARAEAGLLDHHLPEPVRQPELEPGDLQPGVRVALQHRHRVVRRVPGARGRGGAGRPLAGRHEQVAAVALRGSGVAPGRLRPAHRGAGLAPRYEAPRAGGAALHRGRARVHRRPGGQLLRPRWPHRRGAVELPDRLRPSRRTDLVLGGRQAVHRHAVRMGIVARKRCSGCSTRSSRARARAPRCSPSSWALVQAPRSRRAATPSWSRSSRPIRAPRAPRSPRAAAGARW